MDGEHFTYDNVLLIAKGINAPQSTADDRNAAAVTSFQMEVEAAALTRAAEDVLSLIRELKQAWFDGKLDTIGTSESEKEADKYAIDVAEKLKRLASNQSEQNGQ